MAKNFYWKDAITGGTAGALDGIDGSSLNDGDVCAVINLTGIRMYVLDDDYAGSLASPLAVQPALNPGTKYWLKQDYSNDKSVSITSYDNDTDTAIADGIEFFLVPSAMDGYLLTDAIASVGVPGVTDSLSLQIRRVRAGVIGDSTTQFDITNPDGDTFTYTYDSTGTDPLIADSDASIRVGDFVLISTQNFTAANNLWVEVDAVGADYFSVTNASGVVESDKTIGTGSIKVYRNRDMLTSAMTIATLATFGSAAVIDADFDDIATDDQLYIDVSAIHSGTAAKGLNVNMTFTGV